VKAPTGRLTLVGTPLGNLGDLAPRAVEVLSEADVILCEDTRRTRALLTHAGVSRPRLVAMDAHREAEAVPRVLAWLEEGRAVALVTDAGMPAVSDPGQRLVAAAAEAGADITVVPGPSAAVAALVLSGLVSDRFGFEGFLPRKGAERRERLAGVAGAEVTTVLFESPHRIGATLAELRDACGATRRVAVVRELTKLHEEVWRGSLAQAVELAGLGSPRGEHVLVLEAAPPPEPPGPALVEDALKAALAGGASARDAARAVAEELGVGRRQAYELAVRLRPGG
jgi:16S rRNA (cytidine1402-2'-O)-methyltransferase